MKIKRSVLVGMIKEELAAHLGSLLESGTKLVEAGDEEKTEKEEKPKKDASPEKKTPPAPKKDSPKSSPSKTDADQDTPKELPPTDEPADAALEKDAADSETDAEEDADEVTGGKISSELVGKTIQSITMEPKSKLLPGAQEIVITFDQIPDPLRILINKSGVVKFYHKGLHNEI